MTKTKKSEPKKKIGTIRIFIEDGTLVDVRELPPGWDYELFDKDNDTEKFDEEY